MEKNNTILLLKHFSFHDCQIFFLNSIPTGIMVPESFINLFKNKNNEDKEKVIENISAELYRTLIHHGILIENKPAHKINKKRAKKILFIQPHCDDSALSCGGTLCQRLSEEETEISILNVFNRYSADSFLWKDKVTITDDDYSRLRMDEDRMVCEFLNIELLQIKNFFEDARKRNSIPCYPNPFLKKDKKITILIENELTEIITAEKADEIIIPAAIGWHVDHRIVFESVIKIVKEKQIKTDLFLYEDYPYCDTNRYLYWARLGELTKLLELKPIYTDISLYLDDKAVLINFYKSQLIDPRFSSLSNIRETLNFLAQSTALEGKLQNHGIPDNQNLSERLWQIIQFKN